MPKVSVIIPTYNRADLLPDAIQSVLAQTFQDFEIIVVDDGSQDQTREVVNQFQDSRIHYIYRENGGLSAARNTGLANARGKYVALLDSDDIFLPEKLDFQVRQLDEHSDLGFVSGGFQYMDWQGKVLAERRPWSFQPALDLSTLLLGAAIITNAVLIRKEWAIHEGGFDENLRRVEDLDLWLRIAVSGCKMAWSPWVVCAYRMHPHQMVREASRQNQITLQVFEQFFLRPDIPSPARALQSRAMAAAYVTGAGREIGAGQYEEAQLSLQRAVELDPTWMAGEIPPLLPTLAAWAAEPVSGDPPKFALGLMNHLPESLVWMKKFSHYFMLLASIWASLDALWVKRADLAGDYLRSASQTQPKILGDTGQITTILVDSLQKYDREQQFDLLERWFSVLPESWRAVRQQRTSTVGRLYMACGFDAHARGDLGEAGRLIVRGVRHDPTWLWNRGVLAILARYWAKRVLGRLPEVK